MNHSPVRGAIVYTLHSAETRALCYAVWGTMAHFIQVRYIYTYAFNKLRLSASKTCFQFSITSSRLSKMPAATKLCTCISHSCGKVTYMDGLGSVRNGLFVSRGEYAEHTKEDQVKRFREARLAHSLQGANGLEDHQPDVPPHMKSHTKIIVSHGQSTQPGIPTSRYHVANAVDRKDKGAFQICELYLLPLIMSLVACYPRKTLGSHFIFEDIILEFKERIACFPHVHNIVFTDSSMGHDASPFEMEDAHRNKLRRTPNSGTLRLKYAAAENVAFLSHEQWIAKSLVAIHDVPADGSDIAHAKDSLSEKLLREWDRLDQLKYEEWRRQNNSNQMPRKEGQIILFTSKLDATSTAAHLCSNAHNFRTRRLWICPSITSIDDLLHHRCSIALVLSGLTRPMRFHCSRPSGFASSHWTGMFYAEGHKNDNEFLVLRPSNA